MTTYSNGLEKLTIALHYAVPPVLGLALIYVLLVDKTFGLFKIVSDRLPNPLVISMNAVYVLVNVVIVTTAVLFVILRCELLDKGIAAPAKLRFEEAQTCLPVVTMTTILTLCTLFIDRIIVPFFNLSPVGHSGFRTRVVKATTVSCAFMALATNDPYAVLLLVVHAASRPSGFTRPLRFVVAIKWTAVVVRIYAVCMGVFALAGGAPGRVSRRSASVVILSALTSQYADTQRKY